MGNGLSSIPSEPRQLAKCILLKTWAAAGNRTLIESSTSSSVNRYTTVAIEQKRV